jgi:hypothetical protein
MNVPTLILGIVIMYVLFNTNRSETYGRMAYKYGFVDTNPARRVSSFFDTCSPENMEDCPRTNNPYEGLPLP